MSQQAKKPAAQWFEEAARCYVEQHQGCAWCGGSHRVFHVQNSIRKSYFCNFCDFRVALDAATGLYSFIPGEENIPTPVTMNGVEASPSGKSS